MASKRRSYDWDAIRLEYETGTLSLRALTKAFGPSPAAISKRAKKEGWTRDLSKQVQQSAKAQLLRDAAGKPVKEVNGVNPREAEKETVEGAAARIVQVVREHRSTLDEAHGLVRALFEELGALMLRREDMEALILSIAKEEAGDDKKRAAQIKNLLRQVTSLPSRSQAARQLAGALKDIISMERQAFNIDDEKGNGEQSVPLSERLANLRRQRAIESAENVEDIQKRRAG